MPVAVAFCPCPPLLVPHLAGGAAAELDELRDACAEAIELLIATRPHRILVIGAGDPPGRWGDDAGGSLRPYGADVRCGGDGPDLPLPLTIGAFLLDWTAWGGDREYVAVTGHETLDDPRPADARGGDVWLVMGDGTAKRTDTSPGYIDERAVGFDASVARALEAGDAAALADLDLAVADELWCTGAAAWKVAGRSLAGRDVGTPRLLSEVAPYGVGYLVAAWTAT